MQPPPGWFPRRGEVYLASLDKLRPVLILSVDALNANAFDVCVVPITSIEHRKFTLRVPIKAGDARLEKDCWAKCDQVTTLDKSLLQYPALGSLSASVFASIQSRVKMALGLA
jgi:mRNA-degrading endonuclease toxin of MazEF toxin-antitoxin module